MRSRSLDSRAFRDSRYPSRVTLDQALTELEHRGNESVRAMNLRNGATSPQFGVRMGDIRAIAKAIKVDHELGLQLWDTGNIDARFLAMLILKPKQLSEEELERMVRENEFNALADWLMSYVVKQSPVKEALRHRWMGSDHPMLSRAGWSLTTERVAKDPIGLDFSALLDRIELELATAHPSPQWTMNYCLLTIGIESAVHRARALEIGERLGVYRDYPVSKGCTSPFAPIAITELVRRKEASQ